MTYTADDIIRKIAPYESVSFDIFDTLIKRCFAFPRDVFLRTAKDFADTSSKFIDPLKFQHDRISAERSAYTNRASGTEEVTLAQIYDRLSDEYSGIADELRELETTREIKCCRCDPVMKKVYSYCRENHKRVFIISDMYLPSETVREILSSCGYEGYEKLYLSSEIGLRKKTGSLFRYFISDSRINPKKHIHIGDSWRSDYIRSMLSGLHALKIPRTPERSIYTKTCGLKPECKEQYAKYQAVICNMTDPDSNAYYQYGFEVIGMILYGMCCWLHERFAEKGHDKIFFLSRDGYIMREAYNMLFGDKAVKNSYLYASRSAFIFPRICTKANLPDILESVTTFEPVNMNKLCDILHIADNDRAIKVWNECGLDSDTIMTKKELLNDRRIQKFFEAFRDEAVTQSRRSFETLISYLRQEGLSGSVGIVDIGWACTMQKYLDEFIQSAGIEAEIYGYYLGLKSEIFVSRNFDSYIPQKADPSLFCYAMMEYPFTKTEGSAKSYAEDKDGYIIPVLYDYEFSGTDDREITRHMQKGALDFIAFMKDGYGYEHADYSVGYAKLMRLSKFPSLRDSVLIGSRRYVNHGAMSYLAKPGSIFHYIINPRSFKTDFINSGWKAGFLKRLLRIPLPYDKIMSLVRRLMARKYK